MGKRYGQHFLRSDTVLRDIVAAANLGPEQPVLEVGPGEGILTGKLLELGARVTAVELDPQLAEGLRKKWGACSRFNLLEEDIRRTDLRPEHLFGSPEPYSVVANLPYYLSTPLLFRLIAHRGDLSRLVLMLQREVARRLVSSPADGKAYGSLSIAGQVAFSMRTVTKVPPGAFKPPPKVDSTVLAFEPSPALLTPNLEKAFLEHIKRLFTRRRKQLAGTLAEFYPATADGPWPVLLRHFAQRRPDSLTWREHLDLFLGIVQPEALGSPTADRGL